MADNPFLKDRWVPADGTKPSTPNPFMDAAEMSKQAQSGMADSLKDVGWQGYAGVMEGILKAPGALFGDLPLWAIHKGTQQADRLLRMNAEDRGDPLPKPMALNERQFAEAVRDNPIGSNSVRTMERELMGINDPGDPKTGMGRYARTAGEFAGGSLVTGPASLSNFGRAVLGGAGFQAGRDLAPDSELVPLIGAVVGSNLPGLARGTVRAMVPNMDTRRAADAAYLMSRGVPVYPGQAASNSFIQNIYDMARKTSVWGNNAAQRQSNAFTRAVSRTFGENADDLDQGVLDSAQRRIAGDLDQLYGQTAVIDDQVLMNDLSRIEAAAHRALEPRQRGAVTMALNEVTDAIARHPPRTGIPGRVYWNMIKEGAVSALNNALGSQDPMVARIAGQLKTALRNSLDRNAPAAISNPLARSNRQYANLKTVEKLPQISATDDVSPGSLLNRVVHQQGGVRGDLGRLAKAGKNVLKPVPTSGTGERLAGAALMSGAGGLLTGVGTGVVGAPAVAGALMGASIPMGTRSLLESQWLMRAMLAKAARGAGGLGGRVRPPASVAPAVNATTQAISALQRPPIGAQWSSGGLLSTY